MAKINRAFLGLYILKTINKSKRLIKKQTTNADKFNIQYRYDSLLKSSSNILSSLNNKIELYGSENLPSSGPALIYVNHQDISDSFIVMEILRKTTEAKDDKNRIATFIAKEELLYKKSSRNVLESIDTFFLNRRDIKESIKTYRDFGKFIKDNKTFGVIFPEGTRNQEGGIGEFKAGAFNIAKKEYLPIIPVTIVNSVQALNRKRKGDNLIKVYIHKKINASSITTLSTQAIANRVYSEISSKFEKPNYEPIKYTPDQQAKRDKKEIKLKEKYYKKEDKIKNTKNKKLKEEDKAKEIERKEIEKYQKYLAKKEVKKNKKKDKDE